MLYIRQHGGVAVYVLDIGGDLRRPESVRGTVQSFCTQEGGNFSSTHCTVTDRCLAPSTGACNGCVAYPCLQMTDCHDCGVPEFKLLHIGRQLQRRLNTCCCY